MSISFCYLYYKNQGAAISSSLSMGLSYCCMSAAGSLCQACFGSTAAGTTGRKRSVLLLTLAVFVALWFQYAVGPAIVSQKGWIWSSYRTIPLGLGKTVYHAWYDECAAQYANDKNTNTTRLMVEQCAGNAGVFRPMALATLFYAVMALVTKVKPQLNREVWPAKYTVRALLWLWWFWALNKPCYCTIQTLHMQNHQLTHFAPLNYVLLVEGLWIFGSFFCLYSQCSFVYWHFLVAGSIRGYRLCAIATSYSDRRGVQLE